MIDAGWLVGLALAVVRERSVSGFVCQFHVAAALFYE